MRLEERVSERTRIARELHDTLLQSFHGLMFRFQAVRSCFPGAGGSERETGRRDRSGGAGDHRGPGRRTGVALIHGRDQRSGPGILTLGARTGGRGRQRELAVFQVEVEGTPRELHPILRDEIYRIAGEALRNAFRHAQARRIEVEIRYDERQFRLRVRDDGKGIDPKVLGGDGRDGTLWLARHARTRQTRGRQAGSLERARFRHGDRAEYSCFHCLRDWLLAAVRGCLRSFRQRDGLTGPMSKETKLKS